jgi:hypothetical protein
MLGDEALARSSVVANCHMNRDRQLSGPNYTNQPAVHSYYAPA